MAFTLSASCSLTTHFLERRLLRSEPLCSNKWFLYALRRINLPLPLRLKRLAADRRVFSLGMVRLGSQHRHKPAS